jgi:hypothetical protein
MEKKIDKKQITRKNNKIKINSFYTCTHCQSTDCHNQVYGDFLEKSLENHGLTNNKTTLTHMEVYKHYMTTYNTAIQLSTHHVIHEVGYGACKSEKEGEKKKGTVVEEEEEEGKMMMMKMMMKRWEIRTTD